MEYLTLRPPTFDAYSTGLDVSRITSTAIPPYKCPISKEALSKNGKKVSLPSTMGYTGMIITRIRAMASGKTMMSGNDETKKKLPVDCSRGLASLWLLPATMYYVLLNTFAVYLILYGSREEESLFQETSQTVCSGMG
eukprot:scaffold3823_cov195-Amphora_coffeaeformis.AAC.9